MTQTPKQIRWYLYLVGIPVLYTLTFHPEWSVATAFAIAIAAVIWPIETGAQKVRANNSIRYLALGALAIFGIELLLWVVFDSERWHFSDLIFPNAATPLDYRAMFFGWVMLFVAGAEFARRVIFEPSINEN